MPSRSAVGLNDVSPGARAHGLGMCFICYNNISAALAYLIYSSDPLRWGVGGGVGGCSVALYCYLDLRPGSKDFGFEDVRNSLGVLDVKGESGMLLSCCTPASVLQKLIPSACWRSKKKKNTLQSGPKWSYNLDLDQVACLFRVYHRLGRLCLTRFQPNALR